MLHEIEICRRQGRPVKIRSIRATPASIPLEAAFWRTGGLYPGMPKAIVEVETGESLAGLGEAGEGLADFVQRRKAERPDQWR
jgi:L-alanine-DL-glutamate epimerase-like enolase superfamily enzyme